MSVDDLETPSKQHDTTTVRPHFRWVVTDWLERIDPGTHRRIKGLRLVTAYGIAALMGTVQANGLSHNSSLGFLAGGFALWASVSEGRDNRADSSRDLFILCAAACLGAFMMLGFTSLLGGAGHPGPELILVTGSFLVGYLKRFGGLGAGIGSQIYIGQLLAYGADLTLADLRTVAIAGLIAALAAIVPRVLSGPAEKPASLPPAPAVIGLYGLPPELIMGLQAALAALVVVAVNYAIGLRESVWAITACTYVIAGSAAGTTDRVRRRIVGTLIGVPLGLACLPLAIHAPLVIWITAAIAMIIYAMALPERYDIACAAFAYALIVTLAVEGVHSPRLLTARIWETLIGAALGLATATLVFPLHTTLPRK
jgi:Fusaric acid resistance protein-like